MAILAGVCHLVSICLGLRHSSDRPIGGHPKWLISIKVRLAGKLSTYNRSVVPQEMTFKKRGFNGVVVRIQGC
jgi:hypothetical protein